MYTPEQRVLLVRTANYQGSGVRIGPTLVLTCAHVLGKAGKGTVNGKPFVKVAVRDAGADLALIETEPAEEAATPEWTEEIPVQSAVQLLGFPNGQFEQVTGSVRAIRANASGMRELEIPARLHHGMSGGLAVLDSDPLACAGLVRMGESEVLSTLIGVGVIRAFLREHCAELTPRMRGNATDSQTAEYFRQLREEHGFIDLRKLRIETGSVKHAALEDIYIPLTTMTDRKEPDEQKASSHLETLLAHQRVLIQGEAGSGKSTFLKRVVYELAGGGDGRLPALPLAELFPIFVKVTDLEKYKGDCGDGEARKLAQFLSARHDLDVSFFTRKLDEASTLVLLDGMDESPTMVTRLKTMELIERITVKYPRCRFAITTRPRAGVVLRGFTPATIAPLTDEAREKFVGDWTRFLFADGAAEAAGKHRDEILAALTERVEIDEMSRNPLMLTALAALYWVRRRLPVVRAELYQAILMWLVEVRPREGERVAGPDCLDYLSELAYGMQTGGTGRREIEKGDAAEMITMCPSKAKALDFLSREEVDSGILVSKGTSVQFWHLQFQEYLAARHLAGMGDGEQYAEILRDGRLYTPEWREVIRLYIGILACQQSKRKAEAAVRRVLDAAGPGLADRASCVALLNAIQMDLQPIPFRVSDTRYWAMVESMQELFQPEAEPVELLTKVAAAAAMDSLDRHPLLRLPTDPEYWLPIPGGVVLMGAQNKDPSGPNYDSEASDHEPVRSVRVEGFWMAKCPVTVWEYAEFVKRGGRQPFDWAQQLKNPSWPVVEVSWEEANEYCRWVTGVRLPLEEEWEWAARGSTGRKYPWGSQSDPSDEHANFGGLVGTPTPVGLFVKGATPEGLVDMAGNVWEWTASEHEMGWTVIRGGAYGDDARKLRSTVRYRDERHCREVDLGFRLVQA